MHRTALLAAVLLGLASSPAMAASAPASPQDAQINQLEQKIDKAATTPAGEYARDLLDAAKGSLNNARINFAANKEKLAARYLELAENQLNAAESKGLEKELLEKLAVRRAELKKLDARLERFRQGEEN
jgi:hypothetical protein